MVVTMATMASTAAMVAIAEVMMKDGAAHLPVVEAGANGLGEKAMGRRGSGQVAMAMVVSRLGLPGLDPGCRRLHPWHRLN